MRSKASQIKEKRLKRKANKHGGHGKHGLTRRIILKYKIA
jgi:hypothetical protein